MDRSKETEGAMPRSGPGGRSCGTCFFAELERQQGAIETRLVCHYGPPSLTLLPQQQPGLIPGTTQTVIANLAGWPPVHATGWCYQYAAKAEANESLFKGN